MHKILLRPRVPLIIAPVLSQLSPTCVYQIPDEWIHFQAALLQAEELTAERLLTYETITAEVLQSDEAEELTFEEFTLRSRTPTRLRGFITEELLTDETVPLRSCSLMKDVTAEESHTDEAE